MLSLSKKRKGRTRLKKNITIICLSTKFRQSVAKKLADELEMFYADVNDIMEYNLINSEMLEKAGQEYFDENERKTIKTIASYENTVLTLNYSTLNKNDNFELLRQNTLIIFIELEYSCFVKLNKEENAMPLAKVNEIAYEDRTKNIGNLADIVVSQTQADVTNTVSDILGGISNYFNC